MRRRAFLGLVGATTLALAGCTTGGDPGGIDGSTPTAASTPDDGRDTRTDAGSPVATDTGTATDSAGADRPASTTPSLPDDCPTTQGLGVAWPADLDAATVESFVGSYEQAYYRDVVVEYEPKSRLDSYELSGGVTEGPRRRGGGWELLYSGSGGIYRPGLLMGATAADAPDGADVVPVSDVDDEPVVGLLEDAGETGSAELYVDSSGEEVDRYVDLLASVSDGFEELSARGDTDTLYVDVDGATVKLTVTVSNVHGDYRWDAGYYVDERVVRRTADAEGDPRNGDLLECRIPQ